MTQKTFDEASRSDGLEHKSQWRRRIRRILLVVEIAAVAGLLLSAGWLWQLRQQLQGELEVAQQIEAALEAQSEVQAGEQQQGESESSGGSLISCQIAGGATAGTELNGPCRLEVPALGLEVALQPGGTAEEVPSATNFRAEGPVFIISQETFARIARRPEQLQGSTIRLASGVQAVIESASVVRPAASEHTSISAHVSLESFSTENSSGEISQIIIIPRHAND